jgi:hypothetical protein
MHKGGSQVQAPLHATRERCHTVARAGQQSNHVEQFISAAYWLWHSVHARQKDQILAGSQFLIERNLLRRQSNECACTCSTWRTCLTNLDGSTIGRRLTSAHGDRRALASAVGPKQPKDLSVMHVKGNSIDRSDRAEGLADVADADHVDRQSTRCRVVSAR